MTDITIPPEAVEAAARAACAGNKWDQPCATACVDCLDDATAALRAGIAAWPGMAVNDGCPVWHAYPHIILPLPQENTNAEG